MIEPDGRKDYLHYDHLPGARMPSTNNSSMPRAAADENAANPAPHFAPTHPEVVFGLLKVSGAPKTIEEMDDAVLAEAKHRYEGELGV